MSPFLLLAFILGTMLGYIAISILGRRKHAKFLAIAEYWAYLPGDRLPEQEAIMNRMLNENPYSKAGRSPIGTSEALIFSDIRLHIALVLRSKNPHAFRPDLFEDHVETTVEQLQSLAASQSFAKVRFVSEQPLKDKRHLQFLTHAAMAILDLGQGTIVYDATAEHLITRDEFSNLLEQDLDATGPDVHLRTIWKRTPRGGYAQTRGLAKVGADDLSTGELHADQRLIATHVLEEAARQVWSAGGKLSPDMEVSAYDDKFRLLVQNVRDRMATVKILRVQAI